MKDFLWRLYAHAISQPPPKFIVAMDERKPGAPVKMPRLWQVMVVPALVMFYAGLWVTESYDLLLGFTILLALGGVLLALVRNEPDDRGGWDDVDLP